MRLVKELRCNEPEDFRYYLRMDSGSFEVKFVTPYAKREDTNIRPSISPEERLSTTLRYLETVDPFDDDLKFIAVSMHQPHRDGDERSHI